MLEEEKKTISQESSKPEDMEYSAGDAEDVCPAEPEPAKKSVKEILLEQKKPLAALCCVAVLALGIGFGALLSKCAAEKDPSEAAQSDSVSETDGSASEEDAVSETDPPLQEASVSIEFPDGEIYVITPKQTVSSETVAASASDESVIVDTYTYDLEDLKDQIHDIADELAEGASAVSIRYDEDTHKTVIEFGSGGRIVDEEKLFHDAVAALNKMDPAPVKGVYIDLPNDPNEIYELLTPYAASQVDPIQPVVTTDASAHTIHVTNGSRGWYLDEDYAKLILSRSDGSEDSIEIDMVPIDFLPVDISEAVNELTVAPVNAYYSGSSIIPEQIGYGADMESFQAAIDALEDGQSVTLQMSEVQPTLTESGLSAARLRDTIATFTSPVNTSYETRTANIRTACQRLDNTTLEPGAQMSFLNIVGPVSQGTYSYARKYTDDTMEELGGGVSQVASALFAAAIIGDMEITSFAPHRYYVEYGADGYDANVGDDGADLVITNTTGYPVRINAAMDGSGIRITITGTDVDTGHYEITSDLVQVTEYDTVTTESGILPFGETEDTVLPHIGYVFDRYRYKIDSSGALEETEYLGRVTYDAVDHLITVGVG